jgi:hypothetical protein
MGVIFSWAKISDSPLKRTSFKTIFYDFYRILYLLIKPKYKNINLICSLLVYLQATLKNISWTKCTCLLSKIQRNGDGILKKRKVGFDKNPSLEDLASTGIAIF